MYVIKADNVNDAYSQGLALIDAEGFLAPSRNGKVLKLPQPVMTEYRYPQERVLFDERRDANPFMHLFEAMWMLGGSNDVAWIGQFAKQMFEYSDDGETLHGAYGHRWRKHFGTDQIAMAVYQLTKNPLDRRVVVGMWDPYIDQKVAEAGGRDVPCNLSVLFNVRPQGELDMTVTNRSNDMIWGAYGANAVHMSILHEYVALSVGLPMGTYYQLSNDLHVYEKHFALVKEGSPGRDLYKDGLSFEPLWYRPQTREQFDADVQVFLRDPFAKMNDYRTHFFSRTISQMAGAWKLHKAGFHDSALETSGHIEAEDWRAASTNWLLRRPPKIRQIGLV